MQSCSIASPVSGTRRPSVGWWSATGRSVLRACRRVLRCEHDVQDVFQATFLVLAGKAGKIGWGLSVRAWLHSVAIRLALHARARSGRRRTRERSLGVAPHGRSSPERRSAPGDRAQGASPRARRGPSPASREIPGAGRALLPRGQDERRGRTRAGMALGVDVAAAGAGPLSPEASTGADGTDRPGTGRRRDVAPAIALPNRHPDNLRRPRSGRSIEVVRPMPHAGIDADGILQRLVRGNGDSPGREQIEALARNSVRVAEQFLGTIRARTAASGDSIAEQMREAAEGLGRAVRDGRSRGDAGDGSPARRGVHPVPRGLPRRAQRLWSPVSAVDRMNSSAG